MSKKQVKVFVIDAENKPLLPTTARRARKLLDSKKAKIIQVIPFIIQINKIISNPTGNFVIGIDDGAKKVGVSIINEHTKEVVFYGEIELRQDISRKIIERKMYRKGRRSRNLRYRAGRFSNRKQVTPLPSIRQRKDSIIRWVKDMMKRVNITKTIIEEGQFDTSSMVAGKKLKGIEFQQSIYKGKNWKAKILWRDSYTCQHCNSKKFLQAHHIRQRKNNGSNRVDNGITLCRDCHKALHRNKWQLNIRPKSFRYPMWLMQGKYYLRKQFETLDIEVKVVYGWMTTYWRKQIGLEKSHANDAIAMVCKNYLPKTNSLIWFIKPKRTKIWENNPTKTCTEKNGFRHYDIVKSSNRNKGIIIGSIRSLKARGITLRTSKLGNNFEVSYLKTKLLYRPDGLIYSY